MEDEDKEFNLHLIKSAYFVSGQKVKLTRLETPNDLLKRHMYHLNVHIEWAERHVNHVL